MNWCKMAVLLKPNGKEIKVLPQRDKFTIDEISRLVNGLVAPLFVNNLWLFINHNGAKNELPINLEISEQLGFSIHGDCFIVPCEELSDLFFIPESIKNGSEHDEDYNSEKHIEKPDYKNILYNSAYQEMFINKKSWQDILDDFIIYKSDTNVIRLQSTKNDVLKFVDDLMNYFISLQEYHKCNEINMFKQYINNAL